MRDPTLWAPRKAEPVGVPHWHSDPNQPLCGPMTLPHSRQCFRSGGVGGLGILARLVTIGLRAYLLTGNRTALWRADVGKISDPLSSCAVATVAERSNLLVARPVRAKSEGPNVLVARGWLARLRRDVGVGPDLLLSRTVRAVGIGAYLLIRPRTRVDSLAKSRRTTREECKRQLQNRFGECHGRPPYERTRAPMLITLLAFRGESQRQVPCSGRPRQQQKMEGPASGGI